MRKLPAILIGIVFWSAPVLGAETIDKYVPNAGVVGKGTLSVAFWDIYDAALYAPGGHWNPDAPFALSIRYLRAMNGLDIANRAVEEMRGQGFSDEVKLAAWNAQMKAIFPNVQDGSVLTGVFIPGRGAQFLNGNKSIGFIRGDEFARRFFAIWLGDKTSEPALRRKLLGLI